MLRTLARLESPIDIASLAAFRALFGALLVVLPLRFIASGWVDTLFVEPTFHFNYEPFAFVHPWPRTWMYVHFWLLALSAMGITLGLCSRISAGIYALGLAYVELIDKTTYLNHYYLVILLTGLLAVLPAGRAFSLDVLFRPATRLDTVPLFTVLALRLQISVVYLFAGLAKLNSDWLLDAQPLKIWLAARDDLFLVGPLLREPLIAHLASFSGALFDLAVVPALMIPKTRPFAFGAVLIFHLLTALLFPIGLFPFIMVVSTTLFFSPAWPRRFAFFDRHSRRSSPPRAASLPRWLPAVLALHGCVQLIVPLRGVGRTTESAWTMRGFNFGWNVMIVEKAGRRYARSARPCDRRILPSRQPPLPDSAPRARDVARPRDDPGFRPLRWRRYSDKSGRDAEIRADAFASLNGRPAARLIDARADLTRELTAPIALPLE